jgi:hypothetical protein
MDRSVDTTPCRSLADIVRSIEGLVLVREPGVRLLRRLGLIVDDPRRTLLCFFPEKSAARKTKTRLRAKKVRGATVLLGDMPDFAPVRRRSAAALIAPLPQLEDSERLRFLRKAAGMLADDGLLLLLVRLRGRLAGTGEHAARVLLVDGIGLPDELSLAAMVLRAGFNRLERRNLGWLRRGTCLVARKNTL